MTDNQSRLIWMKEHWGHLLVVICPLFLGVLGGITPVTVAESKPCAGSQCATKCSGCKEGQNQPGPESECEGCRPDDVANWVEKRRLWLVLGLGLGWLIGVIRVFYYEHTQTNARKSALERKDEACQVQLNQQAQDLQTKRNQALKFGLEALHKRLWGANGGFDPEYRVSFYVPTEGRTGYRCFHRTGPTGVTDRVWASGNPSDSRTADGMVGFIFEHGGTWTVSALPDNYDQNTMQEYLKETHATESIFNSLSWKGAAMYGTEIVVPQGYSTSGVLLIERRKPGTAVDIGDEAGFSNMAALLSAIWEISL